MAGCNNRSYSDCTVNDPDKSLNSIDLKTAVISGTFEGLSKEEIDTFYMQNVQNIVDVSVGKGVTPKPKERKKGSFQITSVTSGSHLSDPKDDGGDDSQDDLDDTHTFTEETLDNTDYERSPISEHDMNIHHFSDGHIIHRPQASIVDSAPVAAVRERSSTDNQSRFRVVKIVTQEPFRRGRWTCFDSLPQANKPNPDAVGLDLRENKDIVVTTGSDTSSAASSIHYVHGQDEGSKNPLAPLTTQTLTSPIYFDGEHSRYVGHNGIDVSYDHQEYLSHGGRLSDSIHSNGVVHFNGNAGTQQQQQQQQQQPLPTLQPGPQQPCPMPVQSSNHLPNVSTVVTNQTTHTGLPSHQGPSTSTQQSFTGAGVPVATTELPKSPATIGHTAVPNSLVNQPNLHQTLNYQNATSFIQPSSKIPQQSSIPIQQATVQQGSMPVPVQSSGQLHQSSKPIHQGSVPMQQSAGPMLQNTKTIQQGGMSHTQGVAPKQSVSGQVGAEQYTAPLAIHISDQPSTGRPSATSPRQHDLTRVPRTSRYSISGDEFALAENDLAETSALLEQITHVPTSLSSPSKENEESSSNAVAIDNKIEQAMDLVKSHLMFAVREEVEVMREQIAELEEQKRLLELENSILRAAASAETLAQVAHAQHNQSMSNT